MTVSFECPACGYVAPGPIVYSFHVDRICKIDSLRTKEQQAIAQERERQEELRRLIREQASDMKNGHRVWPDGKIAPYSLDRMHGEGTLLDLLEDTGNGTAKDYWPKHKRIDK